MWPKHHQVWPTGTPVINLVLVALSIAVLLSYGRAVDFADLVSYPSLIDDSQIVRYVGGDGFSANHVVRGILDEPMISSLLHTGKSSRFRPGYYTLKGVETIAFGTHMALWYLLRVVGFLAAGFTIAVIVGKWFGTFPSALFAVMWFVHPAWSDLLVRVGPAEHYLYMLVPAFFLILYNGHDTWDWRRYLPFAALCDFLLFDQGSGSAVGIRLRRNLGRWRLRFWQQTLSVRLDDNCRRNNLDAYHSQCFVGINRALRAGTINSKLRQTIRQGPSAIFRRILTGGINSCSTNATSEPASIRFCGPVTPISRSRSPADHCAPLRPDWRFNTGRHALSLCSPISDLRGILCGLRMVVPSENI